LFYLYTNEKIIVTLHANSIEEALYKNKFESSETPTRTGTVTVNCSVCSRQTMTEQEKSSDLNEISAASVRLGVG